MSVELQRPGLFARSLEFDKGDAPAGHQDKAIGHSVHAGADELGAEAAGMTDRLHKFSFNLFFKQSVLLFIPHREPSPVPPVKIVKIRTITFLMEEDNEI